MRSRGACFLALLPRLIFLLGLFSLSIASARADTIVTFTLSTDYHGPGLSDPSGTVTIDSTTGVVEAIDLGFAGVDLSSYLTYTYVGLSLADYEISETWVTPTTAENFYVDIEILLPVSTLIGYDGGPICSVANPCPASSSVGYLNTGGSIVEGDLSTPEPSSLVLLGTGLLGLAGVGRRGAHV